jgi:hypothetical protein
MARLSDTIICGDKKSGDKVQILQILLMLHWNLKLEVRSCGQYNSTDLF